MSELSSVNKIKSLTQQIESVTGKSHSNLTVAIQALKDGYSNSGGSSGIIDVTELPTSGIDENAIYRIVESIQIEKTEVYFKEDDDVVTLQQYINRFDTTIIANIYEVDQLPSDMKETDMTNLSQIHIYILRSDGVPYISIQGSGVVTLGAIWYEELGHDKGFTTNIYEETEDGVYTTLEAVKQIEHYYNYSNEWQEITAFIRAVTPHNLTDKIELSGDYLLGSDVVISQSDAIVNIRDLLLQEKSIPGKVQVRVDIPNVSQFISKELTEVPERYFVNSNGFVTESIGAYAFAEQSSLQTVSIPDGLMYINRYAFSNCQKLHLETLSDNIVSIGEGAFELCIQISLKKLPSKLNRIEDKSFYCCNNLELSELPIGITYIGDQSFSSCEKMTISSLPDNLEIIGASAFEWCTNLALTEIPEGVRRIGNYAFNQCHNIEITSLPSSLEELGYYSIVNCSKIQNLTLKSKCISDYSIIFDENLQILNVPWSLGEVKGAPWGATNATINYNYTGE